MYIYSTKQVELSEERHSENRSELLRVSRDRQVSFRWALAIDQRLDALRDRAIDAGQKPSRSELVAAIILACETSGDDLAKQIARLRTARVADVVLDDRSESGEVISLRLHGPGPRRSRDPR